MKLSDRDFGTWRRAGSVTKGIVGLDDMAKKKRKKRFIRKQAKVGQPGRMRAVFAIGNRKAIDEVMTGEAMHVLRKARYQDSQDVTLNMSAIARCDNKRVSSRFRQVLTIN